jgi:hypothetical protein
MLITFSIMWKLLAALLALSVAGPLRADTLLTYDVNAPVAVGVNGKATGGHYQRHVMIGQGRVRVEDQESVRILRQDQHEIYDIELGTSSYCRHGLPLDLKAELPADLYEGLQSNPHDRGPATVHLVTLGERKVGRWQATGTRIEVSDAPDSWTKVSVWTTTELPQAAYALVAALNVAVAPLARSRLVTARTQEEAKLPGVPVRIEVDSRDDMSGDAHTEINLVAVEDHAATEADYLPAKGLKRAEYYLCYR